MTQTALPLTALSEAQRTQALDRLEIIRPALEKHVSQAQVARTHHLPPVRSNFGSSDFEKRDWLGSPMPHAQTKASLAACQSKRSPWLKGWPCKRLHVQRLPSIAK